MRSWAVNRMDVLENKGTHGRLAGKRQHLRAQLTGEFLAWLPLHHTLHSPSITLLDRGPGPSPQGQHTAPSSWIPLKQLSGIFSNYSSPTLDGGKKPFCEMVRVMTTINLWLWLSAVLARLWTVAYADRVSLRNCFLALCSIILIHFMNFLLIDLLIY